MITSVMTIGDKLLIELETVIQNELRTVSVQTGPRLDRLSIQAGPTVFE